MTVNINDIRADIERARSHIEHLGVKHLAHVHIDALAADVEALIGEVERLEREAEVNDRALDIACHRSRNLTGFYRTAARLELSKPAPPSIDEEAPDDARS